MYLKTESERFYQYMSIKQKIPILACLIMFLLILTGNTLLVFETFAQNVDSPKTVSRTVLVELFIQEGCLPVPPLDFA